MTLPDASFVCKNIDVVWWCERHDSGFRTIMLGPTRCDAATQDGDCRMVMRGLVDLSEVIPAEVENRWHCVDCADGAYSEDIERADGAVREQHYATPWQPVVSDKE
jgi:hypothetical protein